MKFVQNDRMRALVEEYVKKGWSVVRTHKAHARLVPPFPGQFVVIACGRSLDHRAVDNARSYLRRIENAKDAGGAAGDVQSSGATDDQKGG